MNYRNLADIFKTKHYSLTLKFKSYADESKITHPINAFVYNKRRAPNVKA
jgi:hypothetical protein